MVVVYRALALSLPAGSTSDEVLLELLNFDAHFWGHVPCVRTTPHACAALASIDTTWLPTRRTRRRPRAVMPHP